MSNRILGLDLGTNSLGWAIVEKKDDNYELLKYGVDIFQEGVKIEKGKELSKAAERTGYRSARRRLFRRKLRKIETLKVLSEYAFCPPLSDDELKEWKQKDIYPLNEDFIAWQRTNGEDNPYYYRYEVLNKKLDLNNREDRYILGRALYHIAQRRGFLSNRLERTKESDGAVKQGIQELKIDMESADCRFLGEYFYYCYNDGKKIRGRYTDRKEHYKKEFDEICRVQQLDEKLKEAIDRAIFFQRPLKSQKSLVGKCTFEKSKSRCPVSHPRFEEYRMHCFINNIKIQPPGEKELRPLNEEERRLIVPLFMRKSKKQFEFKDIAKKLAGGDNYMYYKDKKELYEPYLFNYDDKTSVSGCPVSTHLKDIFGDDWKKVLKERYTAKTTKNGDKTPDLIVNDIWHVLFSFTDEEKLKEFAMNKLGCSEEEAIKFCDINIPQEYAALSLNAIDKILPYLRRGMLYSHSVFLANMGKIVPSEIWGAPQKRDALIGEVTDIIDNFTKEDRLAGHTIEDRIFLLIDKNYGGISSERKKKLYHPSMLEAYPDVKADSEGYVRLGSPRVGAVRNPMAMRALFRLRKLINQLIAEGAIDENTKIRIELARELNDANKRKAIEAYQCEREAERKKYREEIKKLYYEETEQRIEPTDDDVLKFQLWLEQDRVCLYTGRSIPITGFIGSNPEFDIEHTIPRSAGGDDSQINKTLCDRRFNREVKKDKLPAALAGHKDILVRVAKWKEKAEALYSQIERSKSFSFSTKESKDANIQRRHKLKMEHNYWSGKYKRFEMTEVPEGFHNSQGVDAGIISKYARLYLKSLFPKVSVVKGIATSEFRKMWGLQQQFEKKDRINHVHHCIDAVTIACIGHDEYGELANYLYELDRHQWYGGAKPSFRKPWSTFTEDVLAIERELLVSHHTPDNMSKQTKKKLRVRGKIRFDDDGEPKYIQGDSARGALHQDTFYGAIMRDGELKHVVRKLLGNLKESDVDNIVDEVVRQKVQQAVIEKGFKQAMAGPIWMNEAKGIEIKKVRCFTPSVKNPIKLKKHRDRSRHEYKQDYRVVNDVNYMIAIYEGEDAKGRTKRSFEIVNNLTAALLFKASADKEALPDIVPSKSKEGYPLKWTFKQGSMVLLYESSPEEIYEADNAELKKRLYKVTGMSEQIISGKYYYGNFTFKHHQEARPAGDLKAKNGEYKSGEEYRPVIGMLHTQLKAFVEGYDFEMAVTGEIKFKKV